ncbi:MAG: phospholipid carrier-dependent glycosyltransferase [Planctomycetota bacterium]|nr:MAG: phospholipid carrier-dependent glycosyltransferase [Planctomycetota bacterium]
MSMMPPITPETRQRLVSKLVVSKLAPAGLVLGVVLRIACAFGPGAFVDDPDGYRLVAENLVTEGVFGYGTRPTAYRPPLYPLLLAALRPDWVGFAFRLACCHLVLGLGTAAIVWVLGRRYGLGKYAVVPPALVLVDPLLAAQSRLIMTETLAAFLVVATVAVWDFVLRRGVDRSPDGPASDYRASRRTLALGGAATGVLLALTCLCRPTFLLWGAIGVVGLPMWAALGAHPTLLRAARWKRAVGLSAAIAVGMALGLSPWVARNVVRLGHPVVGTTHGGYTFYLANNPWFYRYLREGKSPVWDAEEFNAHWAAERRTCRGDEVCADRKAYQAAMRAIKNDPAGFAWACVVRFGRFWSPLPHRLSSQESWERTVVRGLIAAWYVGWGVVVLLGALKRWSSIGGRGVWETWLRLWPGIACVLALSAAHTLFWSNMRMRTPLMPMLWLWAVWVVCGSVGMCSIQED